MSRGVVYKFGIDNVGPTFGNVVVRNSTGTTVFRKSLHVFQFQPSKALTRGVITQDTQNFLKFNRLLDTKNVTGDLIVQVVTIAALKELAVKMNRCKDWQGEF